MKRTLFGKLGIGLMACGFALLSFAKVPLAAESSDPIKFAMNDWSSQLINSRIMGSVLEQAGYNV